MVYKIVTSGFADLISKLPPETKPKLDRRVSIMRKDVVGGRRESISPLRRRESVTARRPSVLTKLGSISPTSASKQSINKGLSSVKEEEMGNQDTT